MKIAIVLVILVIATLVFHFVSPWYFTPIASDWGAIDDTINITFWVTGIVFVAVNLFLAYVVYRFQHKKDLKADYEPENTKLELTLVAITAIGVTTMLVPGLFVWNKFITVPNNANVVEAIGQQWEWTFRFPGEDGELGKVDTSLITSSNPFGIDTTDTNGQDDILVASNELHLPIGEPTKVLLRSKDVLHNFAVPQFRVKMDLVPGTETFVWFTPTKLGVYELLCEELCGLAHHTMRGRVVIEDTTSYSAWLETFPTFKQTQQIVSTDPEQGRALFAVCSGCHGVNGEGNVALNAPNLSGMADWYVARQLRYYKEGIRGAHKDDLYGLQMAPMASVLTDDAAVNNVAAFIQTLAPAVVDASIEGNVSAGSSYYETCSICHGKEGQGNPGLNAPGLAGQHDWYLKRQLQNFKAGIRGKHEKDLYGIQMQLMAKILQDEQAVDDLVAYINTF